MFTPAPSHPTFDRPPSDGAGARCVSRWTPHLQRRAVRLYLAEGLTAAEVADVLGPPFSRAAVVSKMRRLGLLKRNFRAIPGAASGPNNTCKPRRASPGNARLPPQAPPKPLPPLREIGPTGTPATLASLPHGACRWPIDDPGPGRMHLALFCGGPAGAHVYCAAHRALAVRGPT